MSVTILLPRTKDKFVFGRTQSLLHSTVHSPDITKSKKSRKSRVYEIKELRVRNQNVASHR